MAEATAIQISIGGQTYEIPAKLIQPVPAKQTVQERQDAVKASAAEGPAGPAPEKAEIPTELPGTKAPRKRGVTAATAPASSTTEAVATAAGAPTPVQLDAYRTKMMGLVKGLITAGAAPKGDVPVAKRVVTLLLKFNKVDATDQLTTAQWDAFFAKTDAYEKGEGGLATLVEKLP